MLYLLTVIIIILNIIFLKSKKISFVDFIYYLLALGWSYGTYDTMIFIKRYINPERYEQFTEPLFNLIVNFFKYLNFDYRQFMILVSFFEIVLLIRFIKKYTDKIGFVNLIFMIYPMITLFVQLRFLLGFTIVLYFGIDPLLSDKKNSTVRFIISVFIATLIHYSCFFYLVLLIANKWSIKNIIIFVVSVCTIIVTFFNQFLKIATSVMGTRKVDILLEGSTNVEGNFGRTILILFIVFGFTSIFYLLNMRNNDYSKFSEKILKFNLISLISIPLLHLMSSAFYRFPQSLLVLNYISISKCLSEGKLVKRDYKIIVLSIIYALIMFVMVYHTQEIYDLVVKPFFENNEIINRL